MERKKIKLSLFYLMLCLIILLCLSNKVIAKENTPNSYNIPTDCYLKVTPRKKKTVSTQSSTPQITVKKTTKVTTKKERMKKTAKKNFTKTTTKTQKRKKVSKNVTVSTVVETVTVTTTKILTKKGSKIRTVVIKTVTTVKTTKTTIATSNNSVNTNSLDRGFMISKFSDIKGHVNPKVYGTYLFVFLVEKICTSSGIALTYGEFIGQEKYSIFLTMITFLISIPYILSFLLRMIKKFIQVVTGNKSVALIFKPVEALISINVLRYAIYILLFFTSVFTYSVNVSQSDYVFSLVKEALLEFVLLDTVIYSIITNIRDTKKNHKQQNMRRYYVPFKYDLEFVLSAITMHNLKDKEMYARIKFSVDINKILKEKKQNDVSEIDKLLAEISTNYYKIEILEQKTKVVLSRIIDLIG